MKLFNTQTPYNQTEEYLRSQQKIDLLLVLTKITEPQVMVSVEVKKLAEKQIEKLLENLK
jgi:hypothetical protein